MSFQSRSQETPGGSSESNKQIWNLNIVPVQISEILNSAEEDFQVEGINVGMVIIVGKQQQFR